MLVKLNDKFYNLDQVVYISNSRYIRFSNDEVVKVEDENILKKIMDHFKVLDITEEKKGEANEEVHSKSVKKKNK